MTHVHPLFCSSMMRAKVKLSVCVALLCLRTKSIFKSNNPAWLANSRRQPWCDQNKLAPPCSERNNIVCLEFNRIFWLTYTKPIFFRCGFQGWPIYVLNSSQMKWVTFIPSLVSFQTWRRPNEYRTCCVLRASDNDHFEGTAVWRRLGPLRSKSFDCVPNADQSTWC